MTLDIIIVGLSIILSLGGAFRLWENKKWSKDKVLRFGLGSLTFSSGLVLFFLLFLIFVKSFISILPQIEISNLNDYTIPLFIGALVSLVYGFDEMKAVIK